VTRIIIEPASMELGLHRDAYEALVEDLRERGFEAEIRRPDEQRSAEPSALVNAALWLGEEWAETRSRESSASSSHDVAIAHPSEEAAAAAARRRLLRSEREAAKRIEIPSRPRTEGRTRVADGFTARREAASRVGGDTLVVGHDPQLRPVLLRLKDRRLHCPGRSSNLPASVENAATSTNDSDVSPLPCVATRRSPPPPASNSPREPSRRRMPPRSCRWGR
jgi:hypothetical protein